jgi:replicative DNA helicase
MNALTPIDDSFILEIEQSLLGVLLQDGGLARVRSWVRVEHFREEFHRAVYETICKAFDQTGSTHSKVVAKLADPEMDVALKMRMGISLNQYLGHLLANCVHTVAGVEKAAKAVVDQWARLTYAEQMEMAAVAARDPSASVAKLIKSTGSTLEEIGSDLRRGRNRRSRMSAGEAGDSVLAAAREAKANGGALTGVTWGLKDVDHLTGGMQRKDLILVGARPSMGKTSLMTSCALAAARKGHGIGILSLEMDAQKLMARALSDMTLPTNWPVPYVDILKGQLDDAQMANVEHMNQRLHGYPIIVEEAGGNVFDIRMKIEAMMERLERQGKAKLDCIMLDHLGFVEPGTHYKGNRNNEIGEITRSLKDYAKEYDVAFVLLSQLSRAATQRDNKRPQLSDLRDSGNIEQDADVVVFLHREAYYLERVEETKQDEDDKRREALEACRHELEFIIAKQRNGPVNTVKLWCDMALSAVRNLDRMKR